MELKKINYSKEIEESKWHVLDALVDYYEKEGFQVYNKYLNYYNRTCPMCRKTIPEKNGILSSGLVNPCPIRSKGGIWVVYYVLCDRCEKDVIREATNEDWMKEKNKELALYFYEFMKQDSQK